MLQILGRVYTDCTNGEKEVDVSKNTNTNCSYHPELFHPSEEFLDNTDFDDYEAEIENEDTYKIHPLLPEDWHQDVTPNSKKRKV
ncbi:hypothetical protein N7450_003904 [Penicillium hetheringtonii]|uniref:Uncharacterized protein n=1 Tax=Penicillium hetheringtonii TaxID=911720 RepID=A0AAD6DQC6_9EURO|nr:hypothetical protein N7450_003904 [Penicillium hetheringtonii]